MFRTRVITALIGVPLMLFILFQGGYLWRGLFFLMAVGSLYEYYGMMKQKGIAIMWIPGYSLLLLLWAFPLISSESWFGAALMAILMMAAAYAVMLYPQIRLPEISMNLFGPLYLGITLQYALRMLAMAEPFKIILLALLLTWASDVGGYAVGMLWGKRKLAPHLSPKKTWEGALGSMLFCLLIALIFGRLFDLGSMSDAYLLVLGAAASGAAQLGDLFMSGIKRYCGVKDSGFIIPGHGGILDRFDSFLLVLPLVYYAFYCVM